MVERYLRDSKQLKRVFLLVDSRHAPSENDRLMFDWIVSNGFRPVVVATKGDKLKRSEKEKNKSIIRKGLNMLPEDTLIMTSSSKKDGIEEVWAEMLKD